MIYHDGNDDFDGLEKAVRVASRKLRPHLDAFDVIVVTGISGQAVGFPLALRLKKPLLVLRKAGDESHGSTRLLNRLKLRTEGPRALFLDDFVSLGETYAKCETAVRNAGGTIVGSYLYRDERAWLGENFGPDEIPF